MKERDIQLFLYNNPQVLFPNKKIIKKDIEYQINGLRIDLLFDVEGVKYIIECKNCSITREHIGQVVEYYGLMKQFLHENNLKMMLAAPKIPEHRKIFLEELGIICVQVDNIPESSIQQSKLIDSVQKASSRLQKKDILLHSLEGCEHFLKSDISGQITNRQLGLICKCVSNLLVDLPAYFKEYEITPYRAMRAFSQEFYWEYDKDHKLVEDKFVSGGAWFALRFGPDRDMPPNDKPNISVAIRNYGIEIAINAELVPSQKIFVQKIKEKQNDFDRLVSEHGSILFKSYLKIEHQPQLYHWILLNCCFSNQLNSRQILSYDMTYQQKYNELKGLWISKIIDQQSMSERQINHILTKNPNPKIAMRLIEMLPVDNPIWEMDYQKQYDMLKNCIIRMKPLLDFFIH